MQRHHDPLCAIIGANVKAARERRGMTLRDVAALTGTSPGYWSRVERGTNEMGVCRAVLVSHALGVTMDQLTAAPASPRKRVARPLSAEQMTRALGLSKKDRARVDKFLATGVGYVLPQNLLADFLAWRKASR